MAIWQSVRQNDYHKVWGWDEVLTEDGTVSLMDSSMLQIIILVLEFACFLLMWYLALSLSLVFSAADFAESECLCPLKIHVLKPNP